MSYAPYVFRDKAKAAEYVGLSLSTFERRMRKDPNAPKPRLLSDNCTGYLRTDLEVWADSLPASTLLPPPNTGAPKPRKSPPDARSGE